SQGRASTAMRSAPPPSAAASPVSPRSPAWPPRCTGSRPLSAVRWVCGRCRSTPRCSAARLVGEAMAPVQVRATVLTLRRVDAYHALTLVAPAIATRFRPGQFVTVAVGGPETSMLGRRAFVVHDVRPDHGGTVEFVFEALGPGTRWLAALRARDTLDAVGPLGRPFPVLKNPSRCLLLGVGYGSAPLLALGANLADG